MCACFERRQAMVRGAAALVRGEALAAAREARFVASSAAVDLQRLMRAPALAAARARLAR